MKPLDTVTDNYAVIDMDTGTVLGTNLRLVLMPNDEDQQEEIMSNDSRAWDYAMEHGDDLFCEDNS